MLLTQAMLQRVEHEYVSVNDVVTMPHDNDSVEITHDSVNLFLQ